MKLCNSRVQNDDGINPCNSQDVLITDCFIRSDDDCVAMKGLDAAAPNGNVEGITVENCILWCDRAGSSFSATRAAPMMRNIRLRNLDIIHFAMTPFLLEPGEDMHLEDIVVENVRINGEGQPELIRLLPTVNQYMRTKTPGYICNATFRNIEVAGKPGGYRVQLAGADARHNVGKVTFDNVVIVGDRLTRSSPALSVGNDVEDVQFLDHRERASAQQPAPVSQPLSVWDLAKSKQQNHRFSTLLTAQDVRNRLSNDEGLATAMDWCKKTGVTKVYLEVFRDGYQAKRETLERVKRRFQEAGFEVSGCVTPRRSASLPAVGRSPPVTRTGPRRKNSKESSSTRRACSMRS